jgi:rhodanese-related sulfurtransferase
VHPRFGALSFRAVSFDRLGLPLRTAVLLGAGAALGLGANAVRPHSFTPTRFVAATTCSDPAAAKPAPIRELPPAEAVRVCGDKGVLVADVRAAERFAQGHVAGAVHLPCAASGDVLERALEAAAGKHTLVVYGDGTRDARAVAEALRPKLPRNLELIVLAGGFAAWNAEGLACSSGPCPDCGVQARERHHD